MSTTFDDLKKRGAQKISEETHIPIQYVKSILENKFDTFSKIQFMGFISILEREYKLSLEDLKKIGLEYFAEQNINQSENRLFVVPEKTKQNKLLYISIIVVVFLLVVIYSFSTKPDVEADDKLIDDERIESVVEEMSTTADTNKTEVEELNATIKTSQEVNSSKRSKIEKLAVEEAVEKTFTVEPKSKVWFGYIDINTNKKYAKVTSKPIELDPNKDWLLLFGHGYVDMYINDKIQKFDSRNYLRFLYKNGTLKHISLKEFKRFNRGRKW